MTEINSVKNGGEVVTLKNASAQSSQNGNANRIAATQAVESRPSVSLERGQDPLVEAAKAIDDLVSEQGSNTKLRIDKDDDTGRFVYQNVDRDSGEVVSQFPPETILEMIAHCRSLEGLVVDDRA